MANALRLLLLFAVAVSLLPVAPAWAQPAPGPSQDPVAGSRAFETAGCAKCHAVAGVGGKVGPDLGKIARPRSFFDLASAMWNHLPRMTARMQQMSIPRVKLDAGQAGDLVSYLYTLHYFDPPGRADTGKRLFTEKKCIACHQVDGRGGTVGPSVDGLKRFSSPMYVAAAMWNHGDRKSVV